jgi:hypothetical protein
MAPVTISVFGGRGGDLHTGEIGGNKILLEFDGGTYLLDSGRASPRTTATSTSS